MYAIETFKNNTKIKFFDCILTLKQACKDAKECPASGVHEAQIIKEMRRLPGHGYGARWELVETLKSIRNAKNLFRSCVIIKLCLKRSSHF